MSLKQQFTVRVFKTYRKRMDSVFCFFDYLYGESDITVIVESPDKRIGLLIEDKIDAIDMPEQPERYKIRGDV